nr:hypothetical protein [Tanacetum cinerariifolium]
ALLPQIRVGIREEFRTSSGPSDAGGNPPPVTIHTWLERFNKQKPHSFEKATAPTRLAMYKFEGNALAWWKAYKQAKGGDAWLITVTWADFKKLFFLQFFPRSEQERLKREYHSIRQTNTETSNLCSIFFDLLVSSEQLLTGEVVVTTIAATTTTLAVTTGFLVMGVTRETGVSSLTDLPFLVLSSPGVPLRAIPTQFALLVDVDTHESVIELLADKKPGASGCVFAITKGHAANTL